MLTLTTDEIAEITGRRRSAAQRQALTSMGIAYRIRPDGTPAVLRAVAEVAMGQSRASEGSARPQLRVPAHRTGEVRR